MAYIYNTLTSHLFESEIPIIVSIDFERQYYAAFCVLLSQAYPNPIEAVSVMSVITLLPTCLRSCDTVTVGTGHDNISGGRHAHTYVLRKSQKLYVTKKPHWVKEIKGGKFCQFKYLYLSNSWLGVSFVDKFIGFWWFLRWYCCASFDDYCN